MEPYVLITTSDCTWCNRAKDLLTSKDLSYVEFDLSTNGSIRDFFNESNFGTVPQIFHEGKHLGGFNQLQFHLGE